MLQLPTAPCCTMRETLSTIVFLLLSCVDPWTHKGHQPAGWAAVDPCISLKKKTLHPTKTNKAGASRACWN